MKKKLILALALVLLLVMPLSGCLFEDIFGTGDKKKDSITEDVSWAEKQDDGKDETEQQTQTEETEPVETEPSSTTVHIAMAGDIVAHMPINNNFYNSATNEYDFTYMYEEAAELLAPADFAIADFESTFHGDGEYSGYPCFDSPDSYADALKGAGIDLITLASNHSLDT
ncbi:MAG: CapA family protein [Lachnospiraceae bacterium]|nr:CapA family protein [Lachnospiraceae bacterium]